MADTADERADQVIRAASRATWTLVALIVSTEGAHGRVPWWVGLLIGLTVAVALVASFVVILNQERWKP